MNSIETTFSFQNSLPDLPLPSLEDSIQKYLKSLIPILSDEEFKNVTTIANKFVNSDDGKIMQEFLETKTKSTKNWIEKWWYDAYTKTRDSLLTQNMGGLIPRTFFKHGDQLTSAAQIIFYLMEYWQNIREEKIEIVKSRGTKWDMSQVYNLFNACRIPSFPKDEIRRYFKTSKEGICPSHIIIIYNGHIWKLETFEKGELKSIEKFYESLVDIKNKSAKLNETSVVPLTSLGRDMWAEIRHSIIENHEKNVEFFEDIDSSVFSLTLTDDLVENDSELMKYALFGSPFNNYCDKNLNINVLLDGKACLQAEHGNVDAISLFSPCDYAASKMKEIPVMKNSRLFIPADRLDVQITGSLNNMIQLAEKQFWELRNRVNVTVYKYEKFGASFTKKLKVYADTIIQLALQMAYVKTHNRYAPIYETASTRKFYRGRTETVRSLTLEVSKFLEAIENGATNDTIRTFFFDAYNEHNVLMDAAREGKGIDRHFLGLRLAQEALSSSGRKVENPLFEHPSFSKSGGNGNFLLSTSLLGYTENGCFGYVTPMCKDGYGTFYRINADSFTFTLTNFNDDTTDVHEFQENLEYSLDYIKHVILSN